MSKLKKSGTQKRSVKRKAVSEIETDPGAEERFERVVRRMLNTPPKPHKAKAEKGKRPSKSVPPKKPKPKPKQTESKKLLD